MSKGFTLIELLIVIGILAILATTVVLVLNPAQILAEARDTQRISDLSSVQSAIGLYLATAGSVDMDGPNYTTGTDGCEDTWWSSVSADIAANNPFSGPALASETLTNVRDTLGSGWVPIDFSQVSGGSPLGSLPQDPSVNSAASGPALDAGGFYYAFTCSGNTYEINANMESEKFAAGGDSDVEGNDGGDEATVYEIGTDSGLDL
jgi:prepilin-type N-terminal cleavage/methylation domain-containing protein